MSTTNPISAYVKRPPHTLLEIQDRQETIELLLRQHVITNMPWITTTFLLIILPLLASRYSSDLLQLFPLLEIFTELTTQQVQLFLILYAYVVFYYSINNFLSWFFNILLVTNERILDLDFRPPLHRNTDETQLQEIQDVRHTQSGFFAVIFNLGNVYIQTAGERQDIELLRVPKPGEVHNLITNLVNQARPHLLARQYTPALRG